MGGNLMDTINLQDLFKPVRTIEDIKEMQHDIDEIIILLESIPFDEKDARKKIKNINEKHKENIFIYKMLFSSVGNTIPIDQAYSDELKQDLYWKQNYLTVKSKAKSLDEIMHHLRNIYYK